MTSFPVRPRPQIEYPVDVLKSNAPSARVLDLGTPYALSFLNRKLMLEPKMTVNAKVVVVGASDVGLSLLENIVFRSHLRCNNITLVSTNGVPSVLKADKSRDGFLSTSYNYTPDLLKQISLETWVNVVEGRMIAIDRDSKQIYLEDGHVVPYDNLVLTPGLQYVVHLPSHDNVEPPRNVFAVNDAQDASQVLSWVSGYFLESQGDLVLYGNNLDVYCAVEALLSASVPGERLFLVRPQAAESMEEGTSYVFTDPDMSALVSAALRDANVNVIDGYTCSSFSSLEGSDNELEVAHFKDAEGQSQEIPCEAFVYMDEKRVPADTFQAVNDSCLVFDGKLVINNKFQTNDPSILAGGTFTKYSRKLHAGGWEPAVFNSKEIGASLASALLVSLDPLAKPFEMPTDTTIPSYHEGKVCGGYVPGGYSYVCASAPVPTNGDYGILASDKTKVIPRDPIVLKTVNTTNDPAKKNVTAIVVDQYSTVSVIEALGVPSRIDRHNLIQIEGLHEKYLNNLVSRHKEGLIADFADFFREPWAMAVFHDRFKEFIVDLEASVSENPTGDTQTLKELVHKLAATSAQYPNESLDIEYEEKLKLEESMAEKALRDYSDQPSVRKLVSDRLLDFLTYNSYHLPMYARPGMW